MMISERQKMLLIFIDEADQWNGHNLYEAIVQVLRVNGIAGATVFPAMMGFGVHRRIHRKGLFGIPDEKPLTILAIDTAANFKAVLPSIHAMIGEGLMAIADVDVIPGRVNHVPEPGSE